MNAYWTSSFNARTASKTSASAIARSCCATSVRKSRLRPRSNSTSRRTLYSGGPRTALLVEAGPEEIQVVAADAQHRVGSELCRDQIRVGNAETRTFGHEIEVLGGRFSDGRLQCQAFHGVAGRPHLTVHWRCSSDQSQQNIESVSLTSSETAAHVPSQPGEKSTQFRRPLV